MTNEERVLEIQQNINKAENMERLYFDNIGLWKKAINPFIGTYDAEDMLQFVYICLDIAVKRYNHKAKFSTYAVTVIRRQIKREFPKVYEKFYIPAHAMELKGRGKALAGIELNKQAEILGTTPEKIELLNRNVLSFEQYIAEDITVKEVLTAEDNTEEEAVLNVYREQIKSIWDLAFLVLSPAEYETIMLLYYRGLKDQEAANMRGISHQAISRYKKNAFKKMQKAMR